MGSNVGGVKEKAVVKGKAVVDLVKVAFIKEGYIPAISVEE